MMVFLAFMAGIAAGSGLLIVHQRRIDKACENVRTQMNEELDRLKYANKRLKEEVENVQRCSDAADAYRRGVQNGRKSPLTQAEKLVDALNPNGGRVVRIGQEAAK